MTVNSLLIRNIISIFLIICFIALIIWPFPAKTFVKYSVPGTDYEPHPDCQITKDTTLYTTTNKSNNSCLFVWFGGGAFLVSEKFQAYGFLNEIYDKIKTFCDVLIFNYPTRFQYTLHETMLAINKILKPYVQKYTTFYAGGMSAGVMLMGAFIKKENSDRVAKEMQIPQIGMLFQLAICTCGMYTPVFPNNWFLEWAFKFYILRGSPGANNYSAVNLGIPTFIIVGTNDFLFNQSRYAIKHNDDGSLMQQLILTEPWCIHGFPYVLNLNETKKVISQISNFIIEIHKLYTITKPNLLQQMHFVKS